MPPRVPLVRHATPAEVIARLPHRDIPVAEFLAQVNALAARLPERAHVVNLCTDRYRFTVGFAAALCRAQVSLLPPQRSPDFLQRLARVYPQLYCLGDDDADTASLEVVRVAEASLELGDEMPVPTFPADQMAAIAFTSGSTGEPTPHPKTWGALARGALHAGASLGLDRLPGASIVGTVPPQHMYGFESTVVSVLQHGVAMWAGRPFYPADIVAALAQVPAPRVLVTTPVHLRSLAIEGVALPPLAYVLSATAPLEAAAAADAEARHGAPVYEIYGFTEAGQVAWRRTAAETAWQLLPELRLSQDQSGWWVSGGHVDAAAPCADILEPLDGQRFLLAGRKVDVVNVAGKRASLASLTSHLLAVPGVRDGLYYLPEATSAAVARLAALVVAPGLTRREILSALRQRIDAAFLPRPIHFVDALPRNATGKVTREALQRLLAALPGT